MANKTLYVRARTIDEAVACLNDPLIVTKPLAGGTDLMLLLQHDPGFCQRVVDISQIAEMRQIFREGDWVTLGAACNFTQVMQHSLIRQSGRVLAQACRQVGATQIRNMGTLGGNVCNAAACADSLPALICLDAQAVIQSAEGVQTMLVSELVTGPNRTRLPKGGLLTALQYPVPPAGSRSAFLKLGRRNAMAISRLTVAALGCVNGTGQITQARLAAGSATPHIQRLAAVEQSLIGKTPSAGVYAAAAQLATEEMIRLTGRRWSAEFKEPALSAMVMQVLAQVFEPQELDDDEI